LKVGSVHLGRKLNVSGLQVLGLDRVAFEHVLDHVHRRFGVPQRSRNHRVVTSAISCDLRIWEFRLCGGLGLRDPDLRIGSSGFAVV
jgi:hypothetical protein